MKFPENLDLNKRFTCPFFCWNKLLEIYAKVLLYVLQ